MNNFHGSDPTIAFLYYLLSTLLERNDIFVWQIPVIEQAFHHRPKPLWLYVNQ